MDSKSPELDDNNNNFLSHRTSFHLRLDNETTLPPPSGLKTPPFPDLLLLPFSSTLDSAQKQGSKKRQKEPHDMTALEAHQVQRKL